MRRAVRAILPPARSANGTGDPAAVADARARIYETIGWIEYFADPLGYAYLALVNLNSSERNGHVYGTAIGTMGVALVLDVLGWFRLAERYHRRALVLAERTDSTHAVAFAHVGLSYFCESVARFDEAVEHSRRGGELYRDVGEIRKWGAAIYMSASVALLRGDWSTAERLARDAVAIGRDAGDELTHGWGRMWLGRTKAARGLLDEAEADLRSAIPLVGSIPDYGSLATIHAVLADVAARRGDRTAALERAAASMSIVRERGLRGRMAIEPFNVTASLLVDELADPETRTRRHRRDARRAVRAAQRHARLERQAVPAALRAAGTFAWIRGRRRSARRLWDRSLARARTNWGCRSSTRRLAWRGAVGLAPKWTSPPQKQRRGDSQHRARSSRSCRAGSATECAWFCGRRVRIVKRLRSPCGKARYLAARHVDRDDCGDEGHRRRRRDTRAFERPANDATTLERAKKGVMDEANRLHTRGSRCRGGAGGTDGCGGPDLDRSRFGDGADV